MEKQDYQVYTIEVCTKRYKQLCLEFLDQDRFARLQKVYEFILAIRKQVLLHML